MATFPCPYCDHALAGDLEERGDRCPSCDGPMTVAYRYRLVAERGNIADGVLYEAEDGGLGDQVAVVFVADPSDRPAVERFLEGHRLFSEIGGRGLVRIREISGASEARPYIVMDWLGAGTLESLVQEQGAIEGRGLEELVGDLLSGLAKAHRSMPPIVHGHIHPGKIGFHGEEEVVLFGFEWARHSEERASSLADTFSAEEGPPEGAVTRAADLEQLAISIYYAATGEWLGEFDSVQQAARVRERLPRTLGLSVSRLLAAGTPDGYSSAFEASMDLDRLRRGDLGWKPLLSAGGRAATSHSAFATAPVSKHPEAALEALESPPPQQRRRAVTQTSVAARADAFEQAQRQQRAEAQRQVQQEDASKKGRLILFVVIALFLIGGWIVDIVGDFYLGNSTPPPPPPFDSTEPGANLERIPDPAPEPAMVEEPALPVQQGPFVLHYFSGSAVGPADIEGLEIGDRCDVWVEPNPGNPDLNCRWIIDCGEPRRRVYGGGTVGYSNCELEDGHPVAAQDEEDDLPDGAFLADFRSDPKMLALTDRWLEPPLKVLITIDGGGPWDGPPPEPGTPSRISQSEIERGLETAELPAPQGLSQAQIREGLESIDHSACAMADVQVRVVLTIEADGSTSAVSITPSSLDPIVMGCLEQAALAAQFPAFEGEPMQVAWSLEGD